MALAEAAFAAAALAGAPAPAIAPAITPAPQHAVTLAGPAVRIVSGEAILVPPGDAPARAAAEALQTYARILRGLRLVVRAGPARRGAAAILIATDPVVGGRAAYRLALAGRGVRITAGDPAGLFYGAVSLAQLITAEPGRGAVALPAMGLEDAPRYPWRGLLLDSARHIQTPGEIRRLIDWMALHKLNVLQWHLTDDQGWRVPVPAYPRLVSIAAWRRPAAEPWRPGADVRRYGGFYTQAEIRALVDYARARHLTIVPEIDFPGHSLAAILAYPDLGFTGGATAANKSDWGVFPSILDPAPRTLAFVRAVLTETMRLFPGRFIAIGGDEAVKDAWAASPAVQAQMRALGLATPAALQAWFTDQEAAFLIAHGRTPIGWDDIVNPALPSEVAVEAWHAGAAAQAGGHPVVLATAPTLYFDNRQGPGPDEPPGRGTIVSLRDVYAFRAPASGANVLGVQGALWTEHMRNAGELERMALPRAAALAEIAWSGPDRLDWNAFLARLPAEKRRAAALGLAFDSAPPDPAATPPAAGAEPFARLPSQALHACSGRLVLNLENPDGVPETARPMLVDILDPCWITPPIDLSQARVVRISAERLPFNFQLGKDLAQAIVRPADRPQIAVSLDSCVGPRLAALPLPPPRVEPATLDAPIPPTAGRHALCFALERPDVRTLWALNWTELGR